MVINIMPTRSIYPRFESQLKIKNLSKNNKKKSKVSRRSAFWRFFKGVTCIFCLTLFFYQSANFLRVFYTYPTTTRIEFTYPEVFELPAITFCSYNPIKRTKFCEEYPNLCENPDNVTRFCERFPSACKNNPSNPVIPKKEYWREIRAALREIYYNGNITNEFWKEWAWSITPWFESNLKPVFVQNGYVYFLCYSENLSLNNSDYPQTIRIGSTYQGERILSYDLNVQESELLEVRMLPEASVKVHSPFDPVDPFHGGMSLRPGYNYKIILKLGEERLLKHPYGSNCSNYTDLWRKNNRQGPRSQQMCKELCLYNLYEPNKNMTPEFKLMEYPLELCLEKECQTSLEDREILESCRKDCKPGCRKLKYTTTIFDAAVFSPQRETQDYDPTRDNIHVEIILGDSQVVVEHHTEVYNVGHLFSYIGGLMGCWLGVSIWDFPVIAENVFRRSLQWMRQIKRYFNKIS